jgi:hypothetical protein
MNHHDTSWLPVWASWIANGALWFTYGMSPLQILALLATLGFTLHRWWRWAHATKSELDER